MPRFGMIIFNQSSDARIIVWIFAVCSILLPDIGKHLRKSSNVTDSHNVFINLLGLFYKLDPLKIGVSFIRKLTGLQEDVILYLKYFLMRLIPVCLFKNFLMQANTKVSKTDSKLQVLRWFILKFYEKYV
jgi:hypothetical protein